MSERTSSYHVKSREISDRVIECIMENAGYPITLERAILILESARNTLELMKADNHLCIRRPSRLLQD